MLTNPFTPVFGGKPQFFFGREDLLHRFNQAMIDQGSEDRALFITGTRGSGKTALLEQLSKRAESAGRKTIDLGSENTVEILVRQLLRHDEETRTISPEAGITLFGAGASISAGAVSKTTHYSTADLQIVFLDACKKLKNGLLVTIDEIQKVPEADLTAICDAFQMASRKGFDVMIAVAGLPFSHQQIIQYKGCTYLRRAAHDEIGLFSREETRDAFIEAFSRIKGLQIKEEAVDALVNASFGHPYIMQLLGYHLILSINAQKCSEKHVLGSRDVAIILPDVIEAYERRALTPMMAELTRSERNYLVAMSRAIGDGPTVRSADVAAALGKDQAGAGRQREALLNQGIIAVPERGALMFAIPLLRQYLRKEPKAERNVRRALDWGL